MRVLLAMVLLTACAGPKTYLTRGIVIERSEHQILSMRIQPRLKSCEGRFGPMASWTFALEMRLICSELGDETMIEFTDAQPSLPFSEPRILCGGTMGPKDEATAREQERSCKGQSGWAKPASD